MDHEHIEAFFTETTNAFHFLEAEYGYQLLERMTQDLKYFQDAAVSVRYVSARIGIEVVWGFADGIIGVGLTELLQSWVLPASSSPFPLRNQSTTAKSIGIYTLATMLGHADDPDFFAQKGV